MGLSEHQRSEGDPSQAWAEEGDRLIASADDLGLINLAATLYRLQTLAQVRLLTGRQPCPLLLNAKEASALLGSSFSAKWLYSHWRDLPAACVRRVGGKLLFVPDPLRAWACDTARTVPKRV